MLCSLSMWRTNSRGAVASSGSGDEQRHAQEQHCGPLHRWTACQHCEGEHPCTWKAQPALQDSLGCLCVCVFAGVFFLIVLILN